MLSLFPHLFDYELLAPFILRVVSGGFLIYWALFSYKRGAELCPLAFEKIKVREICSWIFLGSCVISGGLLIVGLLVQAAAIIAIILNISLGFIVKAKLKNIEFSYLCFVLAIISFCLLFLGPGFYSIDLPM